MTKTPTNRLQPAPLRLSRRPVTAAAVVAIAALLAGCNASDPTTPAASSPVTPATTPTAVDGVVIPVTVTADRAPAELTPTSTVQIFGVDDPKRAVGRYALLAEVVAVRNVGDRLIVDLRPDNFVLPEEHELAAALVNPPRPISLAQVDGPNETAQK